MTEPEPDPHGPDGPRNAGDPLNEASALVVEVPGADTAVGEWRRELDPTAQLGMPAHITLLYPFRRPSSIDAATLAEALDAIGDHEPFSTTLRSVSTFPGGVVWLRPEPSEPFVQLTRSLVDAFPDCSPYEGRFDELVPHLTVGTGVSEVDRDRLVESAGRVVAAVPIEQLVDSVSLFTRGASGGWVRRTTIPLGTAGEPVGRSR